MSGFKTFIDNDPLTAEEVNGYLMKQAVIYFSSRAARASALNGSPAQVVGGMVTYLADERVHEFWDATLGGWYGLGETNKKRAVLASPFTPTSSGSAASADAFLVVGPRVANATYRMKGMVFGSSVGASQTMVLTTLATDTTGIWGVAGSPNNPGYANTFDQVSASSTITVQTNSSGKGVWMIEGYFATGASPGAFITMLAYGNSGSIALQANSFLEIERES